MSYIKKTLTDGERISFQAAFHWVYLLQAATPAIVAVFFFSLDGWFFVALALPFFYGALRMIVRWLTTEVVLTTRRFVIKCGWIRRSTEEIAVKQVEGVNVVQGVFGRILGYGTLTVNGTGNAKVQTHNYIREPLGLRKSILSQEN